MDRIPNLQQNSNPLDNIPLTAAWHSVAMLLDAELRRIWRQQNNCIKCLFYCMDLHRCQEPGPCDQWTALTSNSRCFTCNEKNCQKEAHYCGKGGNRHV